MLNGPWGSGKTWFIKQFMAQLQKQERQALYVTMYGVKGIEDISAQLFPQLHPVLSSRPIRLSKLLFNSLLQTTVKLDLADFAETELKLSLPDLEMLGSPEGVVLIFDDLERSAMSMGEALALINQYVEHDGYRVIVLANEAMCDQDNAYRIQKEKVIGRTLRIHTQAQEAIATFLAELPEGPATVLKTRTQIVLDVLTASGYENLRYLRQSLLDFLDLWDCLPIDSMQLESNPEFLDRLIHDVVAISIEYRAGALPVGHLDPMTVHKENMLKNVRSLNGISTPPLAGIDRINLHGLQYFNMLALPTNTYVQFFSHGRLPHHAAVEGVKASRYFVGNDTPAWMRLWHRFDLSDQEFADVSAEVLHQLREADFSDEEVLLHVSALLINLAHDGLIKETPQQIFNMAARSAEAMLRQDLIDPGTPDYPPALDPEAAFGLGFSGREHEEFISFKRYLEEVQARAREKAFASWSKEWLTKLEASPREAITQIGRLGKEAIYSNQPIFATVDVLAFLNIVTRAEARTLQGLQHAISERYKMTGWLEEWKSKEAHFIFSAAESLSEIVSSDEGPASWSKFVLKGQLLPALTAAAENLRSAQRQNPEPRA